MGTTIEPMGIDRQHQREARGDSRDARIESLANGLTLNCTKDGDIRREPSAKSSFDNLHRERSL
jgi:hypothetical protein